MAWFKIFRNKKQGTIVAATPATYRDYLNIPKENLRSDIEENNVMSTAIRNISHDTEGFIVYYNSVGVFILTAEFLGTHDILEITTIKDNIVQDVPGKTYNNTNASQAKDNVKDIIFWGNGDLFKLMGKASSKNEKWMKSTKAMEIEGVGCVVQVTTQQGENVAEALVFVPGVTLKPIMNEELTEVVGRELISLEMSNKLARDKATDEYYTELKKDLSK